MPIPRSATAKLMSTEQLVAQNLLPQDNLAPNPRSPIRSFPQFLESSLFGSLQENMSSQDEDLEMVLKASMIHLSRQKKEQTTNKWVRKRKERMHPKNS
jgi:hypothetical protein